MQNKKKKDKSSLIMTERESEYETLQGEAICE